MSRKIGQNHCMIIANLAVYAIATDVLCSNKDEFNDVVLRMAGFHNCLHIDYIHGRARPTVWRWGLAGFAGRIWDHWSDS